MSNKILKIVLITKNERYLIRQWIEYHGSIFGYENLHIIDDSDDPVVLKYYDDIKYSGISFYNNIDSNLNNLEVAINNTMNLIKDKYFFKKRKEKNGRGQKINMIIILSFII